MKAGQYFTTNPVLKEKVFEFVLNSPTVILEPSVGRGDIVEYFLTKYALQRTNVLFDMYEIDSSIEPLTGIERIQYCDFLTQNIEKRYSTIIGNPPFVRTKKGNLYIDFTEKCFNLLTDKGELVFIVPSDFFKVTKALSLLNRMLEQGVFTHVFHPNDERMFANAVIDVIVFRYCKDERLKKETMYNGQRMNCVNNNGMITFCLEEKSETLPLSSYFDVYVGIVSGKDEIYKNQEFGNIEVLVGENDRRKFICIEKYPCENDKINRYLLEHKNVLMSRKIRKFNEKNWFEWGALRNVSAVERRLGRDCIYVYNLTRRKNVAFRGKVEYFGGNLLALISKNEIDLDRVVNWLNSDTFKSNFLFSERFKIGQRQISNISFDI